MLKAIGSGRELRDSDYYSCVSDIIGAEELEALKNITHHVSTTRFQHCLNVSYYSWLICRRLGLNARSAARAGLLHDLFFYDRRAYNAARRRGSLSHAAAHSAEALRNAAGLTPLTPLEADMIAKHMWPATAPLPRYKETFVITLVDKYCAVLEFSTLAARGRASRKRKTGGIL